MGFESLSDEDLLRILRSIADTCVRVTQMPDEERHYVGKKGGASPEQAGTLSAVFAFHLLREAERRGLSEIQTESPDPSSSVTGGAL